MAEGGEISSTVQGSDTFFEYKCTPCATEGIIQGSLKYCQECEEFLCAACVNHHKKVSATKKHNLKENEFQHCEKDSVVTTSDEDKMFKCLFHPDRDIEMYCGEHDMVYCALCIAKEHRQCSVVFELEEAAEKILVSKEDILRQIDSVQTRIQLTRQKKEENQVALQQEKNDILKIIEETELLITDRVQDLALKAKEKTCFKYDLLSKDIQNEDSILLQAINDTYRLRERVDTQSKLDTRLQFARHKLQCRSVSETEETYESVQKDEKKMKCFKNNWLIQQVLTDDYLVQIVGSKSSFVNRSISVSKKYQKEVGIKSKHDKQTCSVYGICQLVDGTIIVADNPNKKLKRLNTDFSIIEELDLDYSPLGLCLTGTREVAVKLKSNIILFVSVDDKFTRKNAVSMENDDRIGFLSVLKTSYGALLVIML